MTAEIAKTVENAYRDVQIAFANEVAVVCESLGVDIYDVRKFVNGLPNDQSSPGANPFRNMHFPGAGVGGHCLPKDTWLLMHGLKEYGVAKEIAPVSIMIDARTMNDWMPAHMIELLQSALREAGLEAFKSSVCVLGYAFLENSDDERNSPTKALIKELAEKKIKFVVHDPYVEKTPDCQIEKDLDATISGKDALIVMTKHDQYKQINPEMAANLMKTKIVIDGRNLFDLSKFTEKGFIVRGIGKGNYNQKGKVAR